MVLSFLSKFQMWMFGIFKLKLERYVDEQKVQDFIVQLRPFTTNVELIRIGGDDDGGYLIPNDLNEIIALFSPGVDFTASFELELANQGINCYLADYSVDSPPSKHELIHFDKKFIGSKTDEKFTTLSEWIQSKDLPENGDLLLQMDIEGSEYETILSIDDDLLQRFRILVIEFHRLDGISTFFGNKMITETFSKLLRHFEIVHIHPNNCCAPVFVYGKQLFPCIEVTFHRRDRFENSIQTQTFPHVLDRPNIKKKRDHVFKLN